MESTLSSGDVEILENFGIRVEDKRLYCDKQISYEKLREIQNTLPKRSSNLRGLYALSHQLNVYKVEVTKGFKALQKEALEIKNMAIDNVDARSRVKEMHKKIKDMKDRLLPKSESYLRNILDYAWNLSELSDKKVYLKRQEANLAKNKEQLRNARSTSHEDRVRGWIAETEYNISKVKKEIKELEKMI